MAKATVSVKDFGAVTVTTFTVAVDGEPEKAGLVLVTHYPTATDATALLDLGFMEVLAADPDTPGGLHTTETPVPGYCAVYGRDGSDAQASIAFATWSEARAQFADIHYHYINIDDTWYVSFGTQQDLHNLAEWLATNEIQR